MAYRRARHRHRRLLPDPGGALRHRRLQADPGPDLPRGDGAALDQPRRRRRDRLDRRLLRRAGRPRARRGPDGAAPGRPPSALAVPRTLFFDDAEPEVVAAFERALATLAEAGAELVDLELPELAEIAEASAKGGFPAAEAFAWHRGLIESDGERYDPRVLVRIRRGEGQSAADLIDLIAWRRSFIARASRRLAPFDGFVFPTVPALAPPLAAFDDDDFYGRLNLLMLRNPTVVNLLDGCAISVPMQEDGEAPSGLTIAALGGHDDELLRVAAWVEDRL